jgi:hypothetical protein
MVLDDWSVCSVGMVLCHRIRKITSEPIGFNDSRVKRRSTTNVGRSMENTPTRTRNDNQQQQCLVIIIQL